MRKFMKAADCDLAVLTFPVVCLVKIDGVNGGQLIPERFTGRTLKMFANTVVSERFSHPALYGLNGELAVGSLTDGVTCRRTTGVVNSYSWNTAGEIPTLYPFDYITDQTVGFGFWDRFQISQNIITKLPEVLAEYLKPLPYFKLCKNLEEVLEFHSTMIALGFEGTVLRSPTRPHKDGRSTLKEGGFLRLKDQETAEAVVLRVIEAEENLNPAQVNEMGQTFRTSHKENKVGKGMAGSFECIWNNEVITVSAGELSHEERIKIWENRSNFTGETITFRFMRYGMKDKPRFPRYVTDRRDMQ